jgi:hypothetical protein
VSTELERVDTRGAYGLDLVARALDKGADAGTLERVVALVERMRADEARRAFHHAYSQLQEKLPDIRRDRVAKIRDDFQYTYASLPHVRAEIRPACDACQITVSWESVEGTPAGSLALVCVLSHAQGHEKRSGPMVVPIERESRGVSLSQRVSAARTVAARLSLFNVLGLAPDDDDDGAPPSDAPTPEPAAKPEARAESPEARAKAGLLAEIQDATRGMSPQEKLALWRKHVGQGVRAEEASVDQLVVLRDAVLNPAPAEQTMEGAADGGEANPV